MEAAQLNQDIEQTIKIVDLLNMDDPSRALAEAEERDYLDKLDAYKEGEENGIKIGEANGIKIGEANGIKIGVVNGIKIGQTNVARNLLKLNMPIDLLIQTTGLSKEEVESLKSKENRE